LFKRQRPLFFFHEVLGSLLLPFVLASFLFCTPPSPHFVPRCLSPVLPSFLLRARCARILLHWYVSICTTLNPYWYYCLSTHFRFGMGIFVAGFNSPLPNPFPHEDFLCTPPPNSRCPAPYATPSKKTCSRFRLWAQPPCLNVLFHPPLCFLAAHQSFKSAHGCDLFQ